VSCAEDLSDLFELELDKLENQYEAVQRLRELARRQEQEAPPTRRDQLSPGDPAG
jgi:hypothetical protein